MSREVEDLLKQLDFRCEDLTNIGRGFEITGQDRIGRRLQDIAGEIRANTRLLYAKIPNRRPSEV